MRAEPIGLTALEAKERLERNGPNAIERAEGRSLAATLVHQFASPLIYLLLLALGLDAFIWINEGLHGWPLEPISIAAILVLNSLLGAIQERRAEAALDKLRDLSSPTAWVYRDGELVRIAARDLVEGDFVLLDEGARVPADGIIECGSCSVDESTLSGESLPIEKGLGEEVFAGTMLVQGTTRVRIERTGKRSALGKIATLLSGVTSAETPLEKKLAQFGNAAARWILALAAVLVAGGLLMEGTSATLRMILFAVSLAVAAVPEGLPAVMTICLSMGVERMAKRKAVVRRLSAVEALGSVTVIATDKTGTLTENRAQVIGLDAPDEQMAIRVLVIANESEPASGAGDPIDRALLDFAIERGVDVELLREDVVLHEARAFDSRRKTMRVTVHEDGRLVSYVKGAPELILEGSNLTSDERQIWAERVQAAAREGQRVLGLGWREETGDKTLNFAGLVRLADPPRPEVRKSIAAAIRAGIRVIMVTGDHPDTAMAVARSVGIPTEGVLIHADLLADGPLHLSPEINVYARVTPEDKLRLVEALQASGEIVAMTGDGVNDAPALKKADLAVSMGLRGSDVAREVSDLVLLDDNFATIVAAIDEGRGIYENVRKVVRFLFSTDVALVILVFVATIGSYLQNLRNPAGALLLPLTPLMLLWINIISDGAPALALGLDGNTGMMDRPPRDPNEPLLDRSSMRFILASGVFKAATGLAILWFVPILAGTRELAKSALFHFESLAQLAFAYPCRASSVGSRPNRFLAAAIVISIGLQCALAFWPAVRRTFDLAPITWPWILVIAFTVVFAWGWAELVMRALLRRPHPSSLANIDVGGVQ